VASLPLNSSESCKHESPLHHLHCHTVDPQWRCPPTCTCSSSSSSSRAKDSWPLHPAAERYWVAAVAKSHNMCTVHNGCPSFPQSEGQDTSGTLFEIISEEPQRLRPTRSSTPCFTCWPGPSSRRPCLRVGPCSASDEQLPPAGPCMACSTEHYRHTARTT
jgi:hypothetical protein